MIKILGSVLLISAFMVMGKKVDLIKRERLDFLENMLLAVSEFKTLIELFRTPLKEALLKSRIEEHKRMLYEKGVSYDIRDFEEFQKGLESESLEGQLANASFYLEKLKIEGEKERQSYKNASRLIKSGSILLGFLFVFILL